MTPSLEDLAPVAPAVVIDVPQSFNYGPTVLQPALHPSNGAAKSGGYAPTQENDTNDTAFKDPPAPPLDALKEFTGTFSGFGFNTIFRPLSSNPKTVTNFHKKPTDNQTSNLLQLNLTGETQVFGDILKSTQTVVDAMPAPEGQPKPADPPAIHFEPGLWMRVPEVEDMPKLPISFCRMGSIPHGTTINAQGFGDSKTCKGAPDIPPTDITPILIDPIGIPPIVDPHTSSKLQKKKQRFFNQDADNDATRRLPQDLKPFIANGTITQQIIDDPNTILRQANEGKDIIENTMFFVSTNAPPDKFGGGTSNIGFNIGADEGKQKTGNDKGNANAVDVIAQYWVSKIRAEIKLDPSMKVGSTVSPAAQGPRDAVPEFFLDVEVDRPKTVTIIYTQIQYSQVVMLDFNAIKWPHVTVATLSPSVQLEKPILSSAIEARF
ncbi:hypothetical protein ACHAPD_011882 [Fusarium lateritium]